MMSPGDTSVLVLAAGPGTRMRSDTPKVLHHIAGRSMLSHSLHAITKLAPQHVVAVLGHDHQRIAPIVADLADALGRRSTSPCRIAHSAPDTRCYAACPRCPMTTPASSSSPPAIPRCWMPTPWPN